MNLIRFAGYDAVHPKDFAFDIPDGHDCYLFIQTHTPAEFLVHNELQEFPENSVILYPPGHQIYYCACQETYQNDWIRFESDESYVTGFPLQGIPFHISDPEYIHNITKLLTWESSFQNGNSEMIVSQLFRVLFLKLFEDSCVHDSFPHEHGLLTLRKDIYNNPQLPWTIHSMAEQLHLSTGYLQILYKKKFGVSCMDDVIDGRVRRAKDYLICTDKNISEISDACGYNNTEHFCRQFRQNVDMTPGQFRKMSLISKENTVPVLRTISNTENNLRFIP